MLDHSKDAPMSNLGLQVETQGQGGDPGTAIRDGGGGVCQRGGLHGGHRAGTNSSFTSSLLSIREVDFMGVTDEIQTM